MLCNLSQESAHAWNWPRKLTPNFPLLCIYTFLFLFLFFSFRKTESVAKGDLDADFEAQAVFVTVHPLLGKCHVTKTPYTLFPYNLHNFICTFFARSGNGMGMELFILIASTSSCPTLGRDRLRVVTFKTTPENSWVFRTTCAGSSLFSSSKCVCVLHRSIKTCSTWLTRYIWGGA